MYNNLNAKFETFLVSLGGILGYLFGGLDSLMVVFSVILILDTVTGMLKAWALGEYTSKKFRIGLFKKTGYLLAIILAVQLDILMGDIGALRGALIFTFIANEGISIIENLGILGVPFPDTIINAVEVLKNKGGTIKSDNNNNK